MNPLERPWRTGRKVGRTIYAVLGDAVSDADTLIGMLDTPELAAEAVAAHNRELGYVTLRDDDRERVVLHFDPAEPRPGGRTPEQIREDEVEDAIYDYTFKACRDQGLGSATSATIANRVVASWRHDA